MRSGWFWLFGFKEGEFVDVWGVEVGSVLGCRLGDGFVRDRNGFIGF